MNTSTFQALIDVSQQSGQEIRELNQQTINFLKSNNMARVLEQSFSRISTSMMEQQAVNISRSLLSVISAFDSFSETPKSWKGIMESYKQLLGSYNLPQLSDNMRGVISGIQLASMIQLCSSFETEMIHDAIGCFAKAQLELLPAIFNQAMTKPFIKAADIAFLKTGQIIPVISDELAYPYGLKTSVKNLNIPTANDLSKNGNINYDTKKNVFLSEKTELTSKGMNIVCSGVEILGDGELFSETELMDFTSCLSSTPSLAMREDTGRKIFDWLEQMFINRTNVIDLENDTYYYHSRSREESQMPYTFADMLKAPNGYPPAGRYNKLEVRIIYLFKAKAWINI